MNIKIKKYLHEVVEAFVSIFLIRLLLLSSGKNFNIDIFDVIKFSFIIGSFTYILEYYNPDFQANVKRGLNFSTGGALLRIA